MRLRIKKLSSVILFCGIFSVFALSVSAQLRDLTIVTEPNATVWIDDVNYGKTGTDGNLKVKTFPTGTHKIRVRADGFKETSQNLLATQKGEIKIALVKTTDEAELTFQQAEKMSAIDREKAVVLYQKAVKLRPKYAEAYLGLARVYEGMSEFDNALKAIKNAKIARPVYPEASAVEGRVHKDSGNEEKAIAAFKRSIAEGKNIQPEAHTGLGLLYQDKAQEAAGDGDFEGEKEFYKLAAAELRQAVTQLGGSPDTVTIYQFLGNCYERAKMYREAIKVYQEYIRNFPDTEEVETFRSFIVQLEKRIKEEQ